MSELRNLAGRIEKIEGAPASLGHANHLFHLFPVVFSLEPFFDKGKPFVRTVPVFKPNLPRAQMIVHFTRFYEVGIAPEQPDWLKRPFVVQVEEPAISIVIKHSG